VGVTVGFTPLMLSLGYALTPRVDFRLPRSMTAASVRYRSGAERLANRRRTASGASHRGLAMGDRANCVADRRVEFRSADLLTAREPCFARMRRAASSTA
jgi:hypothetical protein